MLNRILIACAFVMTVVCAGYAQSTVFFSAEPGTYDVRFGATAVPDGNSVRIGYFDKGLDLAANAGNLAVLSSAWHQYGSTAIQTLSSQPGRFTDSASTFDTQFDQQKIYMWIFKTANNAVPTANYDNVTGYGLFSSGSASWGFPPVGSLAGGTTYIYSSEVTQSWYGNFDSSGQHLLLTAVPEPSLLALLVLALGGLIVFKHPPQEKKP